MQNRFNIGTVNHAKYCCSFYFHKIVFFILFRSNAKKKRKKPYFMPFKNIPLYHGVRCAKA